LRSAFASGEEHRFFVDKFDQVATGALDTWDYSWCFAVLTRQGLAVQPYRNLVRNAGIGDPRAAHTTRGRRALTGVRADEMVVVGLREPALQLPDFDRDRIYFKSVVGRFGRTKRAIRSLRSTERRVRRIRRTSSDASGLRAASRPTA